MERPGGLAVAVAVAAVACSARTVSIDQSASTDPRRGETPSTDAALSDAAVCANVGPPIIYAITRRGNLWTIDPRARAIHLAGHVACPANGAPYSLAIDGQGVAYANYDTGEIFRVDTATLACAPTAFVPGKAGFPLRLGMAFVMDLQGTGETLFIAGDIGTPSRGRLSPFGTLDVMTFVVHPIGNMQFPVIAPALTGRLRGEIWAFVENPLYSSAPIYGQLFNDTGGMRSEATLGGVELGSAWTFAFANGDFYFFTATAATTVIFNVVNGSSVEFGSLSDEVVGAAATSCAR